MTQDDDIYGDFEDLESQAPPDSKEQEQPTAEEIAQREQAERLKKKIEMKKSFNAR